MILVTDPGKEEQPACEGEVISEDKQRDGNSIPPLEEIG